MKGREKRETFGRSFVQGGQTLAQQAAFFRDPHGDFAFCESKMKTNHESTKVRKHEKEKI